MLAERYDALLFDLDGVVYTGPDPVPGAVKSITALRELRPVRYVTNNASRTPEQVSDQISALGVPCTSAEVTSSAHAVAELLRTRYPAGTPVLTVGGKGLLTALRERELEPVGTLDEGPAVAVQGFDPEVSWRRLAELAAAVHSGIPWYASNLDLTIPTDRGIMPGNGSLAAAVTNATGRQPESAGKPEPAIFRTALQDTGGSTALVIGDRLDTDILGGNRAGMDTALVLTGVHGLADALYAPEAQRPRYILRSLRDLQEDLDQRIDQAYAGMTVADGALRMQDAASGAGAGADAAPAPGGTPGAVVPGHAREVTAAVGNSAGTTGRAAVAGSSSGTLAGNVTPESATGAPALADSPGLADRPDAAVLTAALRRCWEALDAGVAIDESPLPGSWPR